MARKANDDEYKFVNGSGLEMPAGRAPRGTADCSEGAVIRTDVVGVRVVNTDPQTPLTQSLAGAEAYFEEGDIQTQFDEATRDEFLHQGFDPLPATPPFHFNDTTTLEPVYETD